ncbi:hypothetical protein HpHA275_08890 [Helicobacter pylori]
MIPKHSLSLMKFVTKQNLKKQFFKSERMAKNLKLNGRKLESYTTNSLKPFEHGLSL